MPKGMIVPPSKLKLIGTTERRNSSIDITAAEKRGIVVCATKSDMPLPAHHAVVLILAASRGLMTQANFVRNGGWQPVQDQLSGSQAER
ncbi:Rossmann-fold NAD(P)-binding domain-containing protein [Tateyamaria pelophila]|uniref:hypothetical protein n=1 Tax=Tateyamaria pelophila TaxID=328415 RepID=UPI001CC02AB9|nr:hypothetical protein [Tateyamaria pelophila]